MREEARDKMGREKLLVKKRRKSEKQIRNGKKKGNRDWSVGSKPKARAIWRERERESVE